MTTTLREPVADVRFSAIGTEIHVLVTNPSLLQRAEQLVRSDLNALDVACSRFRSDSEISGLGGGRCRVGRLLAHVLCVSLEVARDTQGLVVPTLGRSLQACGYDVTFAEVAADGPAIKALVPQPDAWREIVVEPEPDGAFVTLPPGVQLDLGSTAKAWAADWIAERVAELGTGVLVNLGGDLAVAGEVPDGGWAVGVQDRRDGDTRVQVIAVSSGGMATSSTTARRWRRGGVEIHHVLDPRTGRSAAATWASVSVAATTCLRANAASTAAIVLGPDAPGWLSARELPALLLARTGDALRLAGWPELQ